MQLRAENLNLTLRHTFTIARHTEDVAENVLVRVRDGKFEGLGEAAPKGFYGQNQASCRKSIEKMGRLLKDATPFDRETVLARLETQFADQPSARAGVDLALHDLLGKRLGVPLWKYWGLDPHKTPQTSFTIGIASMDLVVKKLAEAERFPVLKIKVGAGDDMAVMREVRRLCPKKTLRVDANCGWTVKEAIAKAKILEKLGVEFIEQPVKPGENAKLKKIQQAIGLPLMADESSLVPTDIPPLRGCVQAINIKLTKCGGLRPALQMVHTARACGFKIMLGCMVESSVMITAAAHLAPLVDYADLDGNLLCTNDPFRGVTLDKHARLVLPKGAGLGVTPR